MKEGCVREFVKGGVCETQRQRETLAPSVRKDRLPQTQPRVPPLLEPPDMLSPSPLFGGGVGGVEKSSGHRRKGE